MEKMKVKNNNSWLMTFLMLFILLPLFACSNESGTLEKNSKDLPTEISQKDWVDSKQSVELDTGITMKYVEMGKPDGKPLILIHGMTDNSRGWSLIAPYFTDDFHVYMIDLRGHGDSDKPDMKVYSMALYAADIASFMEKLQIEEADIVGHSLGSMIGQTFAINYPDKVTNLILEASTPVNVEYFGNGLYEAAVGFGENQPDDEFMEGWYSNPNPVDEEFLSYEMKESQALPPYDWRQITKGFSFSNLLPFMDELKSPTLILWGTEDSFFGKEHQDELKSLIPHADFISYEGIGHNIQWEIPEKMAADIRDFLSK